MRHAHRCPLHMPGLPGPEASRHVVKMSGLTGAEASRHEATGSIHRALADVRAAMARNLLVFRLERQFVVVRDLLHSSSKGQFRKSQTHVAVSALSKNHTANQLGHSHSSTASTTPPQPPFTSLSIAILVLHGFSRQRVREHPHAPSLPPIPLHTPPTKGLTSPN